MHTSTDWDRGEQDSHLTFAGIWYRPPEPLAADLPLRQLVLDTLVAWVETLRTLPLLYRVKALELPDALLLIELRQLLDVVDADMTDAVLTDAAGDTPRWRAAFAFALTLTFEFEFAFAFAFAFGAYKPDPDADDPEPYELFAFEWA